MLTKRTKHRQSALLIFSVFIGLVLTACTGDEPLSDEENVRTVLNAMELGAQERSLSAVMEHVSPRYKDAQANDFKAVQRLIQLQFIRNQNINIFSKIRELEIIDNAAGNCKVRAGNAAGSTRNHAKTADTAIFK